MPKTVVKRDGKEVSFDQNKIVSAISRANSDAADEPMSFTDIVFVTEKVVEQIDKTGKNDVESVQDSVEENLSKYGFVKTAKKYIIYREEHARQRKIDNELMETLDNLTFKPTKDMDIKRENANIDGSSSMGAMLRYGSESSKSYLLNHVLPKDIAEAHINGDIHIHDLDFYMLTETCCQIDLRKLFKNGFSTGHGSIRPPQSIGTYAALACIAIQANQNDQHGGQSIPAFDHYMADGVRKTYNKEFRDAFTQGLVLLGDYQENDATEKVQAVLGDAPVEMDMVDSIKLPSDHTVTKAFSYAKKHALERTDHLTYQAMESLVHNLNTMASRAGAQVPFSSVNFGTDTSSEGRMVIKNFLKSIETGLGGGEVSIFPVSIFRMKEGINYNPGDPNYDLFKYSLKVSAKRLFPNYLNLDAPFNAQYFKEGDIDSYVACMGCRTRVIGNTYDPTREVTPGRGNLSFTTINLPRLGIESKGDEKVLFEKLDAVIDLVIRQLLHRFSIQAKRKVRNYPFLFGNSIWMDSDKLDLDDEIGEVLKHGTLGIGFIGVSEMLVAMLGKHHGESEEAQGLGLRVVKHMRERCDEASKKYRMNFSLLGTPAEGLAGRFVPLDVKRYGVINGVTDKEYYTNSSHLNVGFKVKAFQKIDIEQPYHQYCNGGHICYIELSGNAAKNPEAFESIIRYMHDKGVGYGAVNVVVDRDPVCGYVGIIEGTCPRCGRKEGEGVSIERLKEIRRKYGCLSGMAAYAE